MLLCAGFGELEILLLLVMGEEHIGGDTGDKQPVLWSPLGLPALDMQLNRDAGDEQLSGDDDNDDDQLLSIELNSKMLSSGRNSTAIL